MIPFEHVAPPVNEQDRSTPAANLFDDLCRQTATTRDKVVDYVEKHPLESLGLVGISAAALLLTRGMITRIGATEAEAAAVDCGENALGSHTLEQGVKSLDNLSQVLKEGHLPSLPDVPSRLAASGQAGARGVGQLAEPRLDPAASSLSTGRRGPGYSPITQVGGIGESAIPRRTSAMSTESVATVGRASPLRDNLQTLVRGDCPGGAPTLSGSTAAAPTTPKGLINLSEAQGSSPRLSIHSHHLHFDNYGSFFRPPPEAAMVKQDIALAMRTANYLPAIKSGLIFEEQSLVQGMVQRPLLALTTLGLLAGATETLNPSPNAGASITHSPDK